MSTKGKRMGSTKASTDTPSRPLGGAERDVTAGQNAGTAANLFEANRAQDPFEQGKETERTKGKNAGTTANLFEQRVTQGGSAH